MEHLGDITKISGYTAPIVDIITGGSPCQDLSVAGKRQGLAGERSGLFMEQVRIVREMRNADRANGRSGVDVRPRFMVWENVPGAFSSNKGEDFRAVLEEIAKVEDKDTVIPKPPGGRWSTSGAIMGNGWSIAWRVHDAQFWGVPQRRKRIALVADFGGQSAPEILFERKGVSRNIEPGEEKRQGTAGTVESGVGETSIVLNDQGGQAMNVSENVCGSLRAQEHGHQPILLESNQNHATIQTDGVSTSLPASMGMGGGYVPMVMETHHCTNDNDVALTLKARDYKDPQCVAYGLDRASYNQGKNAKFGFSVDKEKIGAQTAKGPGAICNSIVRRLTPLECERLQGYPTIRTVRFTKMTKDEYIAWNINEGNIIVDTDNGKIFATRGPGGKRIYEPKELKGSIVNGYKVVSIRNGDTKMQCRVHRIIWIAKHGIIEDGYVIDHINNDKQDNRLCNLQLLTPKENSSKARKDGLYKIHEEAGQAKITNEVHDFIQYVYGNSDLSIRQLSEIFGISKSRVCQIIHDEPWTDIGEWYDSKGKKHKPADSPRYKALGNSIALPFWQWMAERMIAQYDRPTTMASLFDGIGGFPLVYSRVGCEPVWASEIEEFPMAVTKLRF